MGEAERELLRRQREHQATEAAAAAADAHERANARQSELARIEALVPRALEVLRRAGWPDARMIKLYQTFGKNKAGWRVGDYPTYMLGEPGTRPVYLLSTGKFGAPGDPARTARQLFDGPNPPGGIEAGLIDLINRYGT